MADGGERAKQFSSSGVNTGFQKLVCIHVFRGGGGEYIIGLNTLKHGVHTLDVFSLYVVVGSSKRGL